MNPREKEWFAFLMLGAVGAVLVFLICSLLFGCEPKDTTAAQLAEKAQIAAALAAYKAELADCRKASVKARDMAVFEKCADAVDDRFQAVPR